MDFDPGRAPSLTGASSFAGSTLHSPCTYDAFQHNLYDWNKKPVVEKLKDYRIVPLTRGYCMLVSPRDFARINKHKWHANVQYDKDGGVAKIYAYRNVTVKGKRTKVYAHRVIISAGKAVITQHLNGFGLDNRRVNLKGGTYVDNNSDRPFMVGRTINSHLKPGVEVRHKRKGVQMYGWRIKCQGQTFRSKRVWADPLKAHRGYLNQHKKLYGHKGWNSGGTVDFPVFPPLKKRGTTRSYKTEDLASHIPF